jgi:tetratricopeptide (TPR) repeat protein
VSRPEPARADNYVNIGDNLFRAGNRHRAEQRYTQAARANPNSAKPHVRLAQLALVRGDYLEAAEQFRAATTAEPGWLINATDVQALFAEPGDFAQALAKLETHLQATPSDRDGWLVLGAEWYLSGRTRQAADVFTRLNDRKPDATLASFLDATTPDEVARAPR